MTATARNTDTLPEGFLETPLAQALCAAANEGKEVTIDEAIDVVVEYGRTRQNAFESDAQVEFFHKHPAFISIPATRVVGRSPTFTEVFEKLSGTEEELTHFRNIVVAELVARGDTQPSAEEVVTEAIALAQACVAHASNYDAELMVLAGFTEVPSTKDVVGVLTHTGG